MPQSNKNKRPKFHVWTVGIRAGTLGRATWAFEGGPQPASGPEQQKRRIVEEPWRKPTVSGPARSSNSGVRTKRADSPAKLPHPPCCPSAPATSPRHPASLPQPALFPSNWLKPASRSTVPPTRSRSASCCSAYGTFGRIEFTDDYSEAGGGATTFGHFSSIRPLDLRAAGALPYSVLPFGSSPG